MLSKLIRGSLLKPGTEWNSGETFRPVPPPKIRNRQLVPPTKKFGSLQVVCCKTTAQGPLWCGNSFLPVGKRLTYVYRESDTVFISCSYLMMRNGPDMHVVPFCSRSSTHFETLTVFIPQTSLNCYFKCTVGCVNR